MGYCEVHEEYVGGISYGEKLLLQDRARERTYCRLMRMRYFAGDRAGALREFQRCEAALIEELGVAPAKQTLELRERICADMLNRQIATAAIKPRVPTSEMADPRSSLFKGLYRLRSVLMKIQHRVELDIQEVNNILDTQPGSSANEKH